MRPTTSQWKSFRGDVEPRFVNDSERECAEILDFYGLPADFPGRSTLPRGGSCYDRVTHLEDAFRTDIGHRLFLP